MFGWLKRKIDESPNTVVTAPGVEKTHDLECRFRREGGGIRGHHGKLKQDRWDDGQERFSLALFGLPDDQDKARLYRGDILLAEFDKDGTKIDFRWKGTSTDAIPRFEIGDALRIEVGELQLHGIVEPD